MKNIKLYFFLYLKTYISTYDFNRKALFYIACQFKESVKEKILKVFLQLMIVLVFRMSDAFFKVWQSV